jgi:hypothetical protein
MMSTRLREAAARHLRLLGAMTREGEVRRLTLDIEAEGRVELVTVALRDDELQCVSSDGRNDGPHVTAALRFIVGAPESEHSGPPSPVDSLTGRPTSHGLPNELAEALDDLLTAIARVGVDKAQYAPSVDAALERVIGIAPQPTPMGLGRFIGRLQQEICCGDVQRVARMLDGASRLAEALRLETPTLASEQLLRAWLGARPGSAPKVELLYDRTMIEVGREWVSGIERASVERRYLLDLRSGRVYREDRPRYSTASLGPCPRQLRVGLAEVEAGPVPQRIRVLQYEVQPEVPRESWELLQRVASRSFGDLTEGYRRSVQEHPSLSEPFVLVAPYRIECNGVFKAFDANGHQLLLNRSERRGAVLAFYEMLADGLEPSWLAGRLTDTGATLCLTPFAAGTRDQGYTRL